MPSPMRLLLFAWLSIFFVSCAQNKNSGPDNKTSASTFLPPQVTILSQLPENKKPKAIFLENAPTPVSIKVAGIYNSAMQPLSSEKKSVAEDAQGRGFFTTYTTDDGLGLDQVYCSYKDKRGNIWFGTNGGGVSKYDGKNFTNYTTAQGLAGNVVWCITDDHAGNLWFGTDGGGVSKYDGERFTNYTTAQGLPGNVIFTIIEDKAGNLWFGSLKGGVSKYDGRNFTNYTTAQGLANNAVKSIIEDHEGNFWFATFGGGVSKFDGKNFTNYTTEQGLAKNDVWCMAEDDTGNLWFGTEGNGVSRYDGKTFTNFSLGQGLPGNVILCITKDKRGNLWFGTLKGGVSKYDGTNFTNYTTAQGLANNTVRTGIVDETGNLWFGTYGGGVSRYAGSSFANFTIAQGLLNNVVFSIAEDTIRNLWFGTSGGGVSKYDGKKFVNYTTSQGLADNVIYCLATDTKGNLWIGTSSAGVSKYDGKSFTNYTTLQGLANNDIFSIKEDKKGNLWFATSGGGVSKFDGKGFTNYTTAQGLANNVVFSITEDKNDNLWFGTLGGGASKFDGKSFTNYTTAQGLANNVVWTIAEDKPGNLWFGTQQGLSVIRGEELAGIAEKSISDQTFTGHLFESFTTKDGLPDNFITQVVQGDSGKLYIGTNLGMCELIPAKQAGNIEKQWVVGKIFNSRTGYPVKDVNAGLNAVFKDSKGLIWIGTGSDKTGLVRFDPKAIINDNPRRPGVYIKDVKINNENICWRDLGLDSASKKIDSTATSPVVTDEVNIYGRQLSNQERDSLHNKFREVSFDSITRWNPVPLDLVLPYYYNNIGFSFNSIETGKNFLVKYQYMLDGYDKEWSPPDYKTSVTFGNISEGTYTFLLRAQSPESVWSNNIAYTFKVLPPWWRTWWMYTVYAILSLALIIFFIRWNSRRIIFQKKILEQKVVVATKQLRQENKKVKAQKQKIEETLKELEDTQAQLIHSEKMASLGELTAGIAHEIQNPLNFVNNFSEVNKDLLVEMKDEIEKGNTAEAKAIANDLIDNEEKINHHGKRADAIVKNMLQHARINTGQTEPTDINALAGEYLRLSYHGIRAKDKSFNATMETDFYKSIGKVKIIPQDVGRVLLNIYNNAFYAVNEKKASINSAQVASTSSAQVASLHSSGQASAAGQAYEPKVTVSTKFVKLPSGGLRVELTVTDNGNGIPQNIVDKIFQPFFTTKPVGEGTGLGLSLSYDIMKAHGGEIKVETKEGEGTTFIIHQPVS